MILVDSDKAIAGQNHLDYMPKHVAPSFRMERKRHEESQGTATFSAI